MDSDVCAVMNRGGDYAIFVLDLEGDGDADLDQIVDLDNPDNFGDEFLQKEPNVEIHGAGRLSFCGLYSELFMFEGIANGKQPLGIYALPLSHNLLNCTNKVVDFTSITPIATMNGPKLLPASVQCRQGTSILVFSTEISYQSNCIDSLCDFELFNPPYSVIQLPPLCIRRRRGRVDNVFHFELRNNLVSSRERVYPRFSYIGFDDELDRSSFNINLFSVINDGLTLVVGTDFGAIFRLELSVDREYQQSFWQVYHGPDFPNLHHNFVTDNNKVVLCHYSASTFSCSNSNEDYIVANLPLSSLVTHQFNWRNFIIGVSDHIPFPEYLAVVQVGFGVMEQAHWTLDVISLDLSVFEEEAEEAHNKVARRIKSFKFAGDEFNFMFIPECLHFF